MSIDLAKVLALPVVERIRLAQSIWDSVVEVPEAVEVTEEQREELNRRLDAYREDPSAGSPWPEIKERILTSRRAACSVLHAGISPEMALRLSIAFDTTPEGWLNQQTQYDLWAAKKAKKKLRVKKLCAT